MGNATYTLLESNNGEVINAIMCNSSDELEDRFADEFLQRGMEPCDVQFEDCFFEFEDGALIQMITAYPSDKEPSGKRNL